MNRPGFIFLCSEITEPECLSLELFGGKEKYGNRVKTLQSGDVLFLYNYNTKRFHGVFEAVTELRENIVPTAWKGEFPWQVKIKRIRTEKPLSREDIQVDEILRNFIKFDRAGRPSARLTSDTTELLIELFATEHRVITYDDDLRYRANDGHRVRSKAELEIDNWLYTHRIIHAYEDAIPEAKRCDFYVPTSDDKGIYIEYWGMNDEKYLKDKEEKIKIYKKHNLQLVSLEHKDLKSLDEILHKELKVLLEGRG